MIDLETSLRLKLLRFPLIVGVVFIHSYDTNVVFSTSSIGAVESNIAADFIRNLVSQGIARIAVPLFFIISGYLFFSKFSWSKLNYINKLRSRINTLFIPFLFWNLVTFILIYLAQSQPLTQGYFSGRNNINENLNFLGYINYIFGIWQNPIAHQFWFIRDLILLIIIMPLILSIRKVFVPFILSAITICWFLDIWLVVAPSAEATLFFTTGAVLSSNKRYLFSTDKYGETILIFYILIVLLDIFFIKSDLNFLIHKIGIVLGILSLLFLTRCILCSKKSTEFILKLSSSSFFVYAAHEPLLTVIRKIIYKIMEPSSPFFILILYFLIPILTITFLVIVFNRLSIFFPSFTKIIIGGR